MKTSLEFLVVWACQFCPHLKEFFPPKLLREQRLVEKFFVMYGRRITMSRIGKQPIVVADKVEVVINGSDVKVKGPKGELSYSFTEYVKIEKKTTQLLLHPKTIQYCTSHVGDNQGL